MGVHGKSTRVLVDAYDLSQAIDSSDLSQEIQASETTGYRPTGDARTYIPGLENGSVSFGGYYEADPSPGSADKLDDVIDAALGDDAGQVISHAIEDFTIGNRVRLLKAKHTSYQKTSPFDGAVKVSGQAQADGPMDGGVSLHALEAETSTGEGSAVDNAASSANGAVGHIHVTARAGTSPTLAAKIRHSVDDAVYADLITFTSIGDAVGSERLAVTGTVNRYVKAEWTIGGTSPSYTFAIAFARR